MLKLLHNRYEVLKTLGTGGSGEVYQARDTRLQRLVAIKRVRRGKTEHREARALILLREAQQLASIRHPNVVTVHDVLEGETSLSIVMELIDGNALHDVIRKRGIAASTFLRLFRQVLGGIQAVHEARIVHRDVNPRNLLVDRDGAVTLIDFGLASSIKETKPRTGGTVGYMAPEALVKSPRFDFRSDIYGAGLVAYQSLLGLPQFRRLYGTTNPQEWARWVLSREKFKPLHEVDERVPVGVSAVVAKMVEKDPRERFASIGEALRYLPETIAKEESASEARKPQPTPKPATGEEPAATADEEPAESKSAAE